MVVHFSPEQEAELSQLAARAGTGSAELVRDAALQMMAQAGEFRTAVREGMAQAELGEMVEDAEVLGWLERRERA